jgi:PAS domain S-box-containing protein
VAWSTRIREAFRAKAARQRGEEARAYLAAIVESSDDAIIAKDLNGIIQSCNAGAERIFGYTAAELVGRSITMLIPPERLSEETEILTRIRRGERVEHFDTVRVTKQGARVDVSLTISPVRDAAGTIIGVSKIARDIGDRKRAEAALRRAQQVSWFLANASVALTDLSDARSILNKAAGLAVPFFADWCAVDLVREDAGFERVVIAHHEPRKAQVAREFIARWAPRADDPAGPGRVGISGKPELVSEVAAGERPAWVRDNEHLRTLEQLGFASYICVPVSWGRRVRAAQTFVVGGLERRYEPGDLRVAEDLAQRTGVAVENAVLYQTALDADRHKDDFLAVLSHELRTPLNAIVGWSHVLREEQVSPDVVRKAVETIHRNAQLQARLISDILDISRIAAGKMRLDVRPVELPVVIEAALDTLRPAAAAKGVSVETQLDSDAVSLFGDAARLQQIIWNLVSNAIKYVPEQTGRVQLRLKGADSHLRLTVEDNGPGIDPEFLPYVFERFRQAESASNRSFQGLGLGLAIVRQLVELHGGTVRAQNRPTGTGAVFTVQLPRRSLAEPATLVEGPEARELIEPPIWLDAAPSLPGVRVLVVDDQDDARDLLKAVLERCGAEVTLAASAAEALEQVRSGRPDVVLSDIEMPRESGYDFVRKLRALPAESGGQTPAVALTAYATAHDRMKVLRAGFQMHVPKPIQPAELATVVASLARKHVF